MPKRNETTIQNENDSAMANPGEMEAEDSGEKSLDAAQAVEHDPWELVPLMVERDPSDDNTNVVIGINGKNYVMPRGKVSNVPRCVYDEYQRAKAAQYKADATIAELSGIKAAAN